MSENPFKEFFADMISIEALIKLFVDVVDVESCMFIWDMLACQGSIALVRAMVSLVSLVPPGPVWLDHPSRILESITQHRISN